MQRSNTSLKTQSKKKILAAGKVERLKGTDILFCI